MVIIYNIILVCSAGMSTSLLVNKMKESAEKRGVKASVNAVAEADLKGHLDKVDMVLLAPQVRYMISKIRSMPETNGIPVEVVDSVDYGMMNGEKVLSMALEMVRKNQEV